MANPPLKQFWITEPVGYSKCLLQMPGLIYEWHDKNLHVAKSNNLLESIYSFSDTKYKNNNNKGLLYTNKDGYIQIIKQQDRWFYEKMLIVAGNWVVIKWKPTVHGLQCNL